MKSCVFCERLIKSEFISCNGKAAYFEPLNPVVPGHLLVVPFKHVPDFATDPRVTAHTMKYAADLARDLGGEMNLITSKGRAATQSIFHLHVHLVPRKPGDGMYLPWSNQ